MSNDSQDDKGHVDENGTPPEPGADIKEQAAPDVPAETAPAAARKGRPISASVAWLALLVSLVALITGAYSIFSGWYQARHAGADPLVDIRSRIAASDEALGNLETALSTLQAGDSRLAGELETLQRDIDSRLQTLDAMRARLANLEASMAALQGVSAGARQTWLLAEAEYYLQIANAQLQLAGNPQLAGLALEMADERLVQMADPGLTEVRRAIADERAAIAAMGNPDIEGVTLTLASLARVVATLPLQETTLQQGRRQEAPPAEASGVSRAWASLKGEVSGMFSFSRPGEKDMPLLPPDAQYFLRTNLTLQLQTARLALLRGEHEVFEQSLDDASSWIGEYFDADSTQVRSAQATINEIRNAMVAVATPDISGSLRLLRQYETLAGPAQ